MGEKERETTQQERLQEALVYCTKQGRDAFRKSEKLLKGVRNSFSGKSFAYHPIIEAADTLPAIKALDEWGEWKIKREALLMAGAKEGKGKKNRNYGWNVNPLRLPAAYVAHQKQTMDTAAEVRSEKEEVVEQEPEVVIEDAEQLFSTHTQVCEPQRKEEPEVWEERTMKNPEEN